MLCMDIWYLIDCTDTNVDFDSGILLWYTSVWTSVGRLACHCRQPSRDQEATATRCWCDCLHWYHGHLHHRIHCKELMYKYCKPI